MVAARRRVAVLGVTALLIGTVAACDGHGGSTGGTGATGDTAGPSVSLTQPPARSAVQLYLSTAGKSGTPGMADSGQPLLSSFGNNLLVYQAGSITQNGGGQPGVPAAGYMEYALRHRVTRAGLSVAWQAGSTSSAALVLPDQPWGVGGSGITPFAGLHLVVRADGVWSCGEWRGDHLAIYARGTFTPPTDGAPHTLDLEVHGDDALVHLPDGSTARFTNPAIGSETGRWVLYEAFEENKGVATTPPRISTLWAGDA